MCSGYERERTFVIHPNSKKSKEVVFVPHVRVVSDILLNSLEDHTISAQYQDIFTNLYMPHGDCVLQDDLSPNWVHPLHWIEEVFEVAKNETSLRKIFLALLVSCVGKESNDKRLAHESTVLYG